MRTVVGFSLKMNDEYKLFAEAPLADFGDASTWKSDFGNIADYEEIFERTLEQLRNALYNMHMDGSLGRIIQDLERDAYMFDEATHTLFEADILDALITADITVFCD